MDNTSSELFLLFSISSLKGKSEILTLVNGSIFSVLTSFNCSTQSNMELNCEDSSLISSSSTLTLHNLAILIVVLLSIFNLYTFVTKPNNFIKKLNTLQTLLGLDFGDKTIGIAVSDKTRTIATPLITIKRISILKDIEKIISMIEEYKVGGVVIGLPLSLNGEENNRTIKVRSFGKELKKNIEVTFYDERFSTDVIFKELRKGSISTTKIKKKIDHLAASYILQGFLDNVKNNEKK